MGKGSRFLEGSVFDFPHEQALISGKLNNKGKTAREDGRA